MVSTRKRASVGQEAPVEQPSAARKRQRRDQPASPPKASAPSPIKSPQRPSAALPKGRRGQALLAAVGVAPPAAAAGGAEGKPASPHKAAASPARKAAAATAGSPQQPAQQQQRGRLPSPRGNPLLKQALPKSYTVLEDFFAALQLHWGTLRRRSQRCTYQTLRAAVEEHTGRRFLMSHLAQLHFLLPDVIALDWVRLPVAPHSSRTEPQLAIHLGALPERWDHPSVAPAEPQQQEEEEEPQLRRATAPGAAGAGAEARAASGSAAVASGTEVAQLRQLLHYRLASFLLCAYRQHLEAGAARLQAEGDAAGAAEMQAQLAALPAPVSSAAASPPGSPTRALRQQQQPVTHFVAGFWEAAPEVPEQPLPLRPEGSGGSALVGASTAAVAAHLPAVPSTPSTAATSSRPPLPPSALRGRQQQQQRRLSLEFAAQQREQGQQAEVAEPRLPEVAAASPTSVRKGKQSSWARSPLDELHDKIMAAPTDVDGGGFGGSGAAAAGASSAARRAAAAKEQAALAAALAAEGEAFEGQVLSEEEFTAGLDAERRRLWDSLPEAARRLSMDGIMSFEAHLAVDRAARKHESTASKEAQEARALRSALGMLPRTFMRLQRIFGANGPNALKMQQVVARLRSTDETFSQAEVESQLRLLAEHAPECCALRRYGSCGTPAVWWDRKAERASNGAIYRRLKSVAEARHSMPGAAVPGRDSLPGAAVPGRDSLPGAAVPGRDSLPGAAAAVGL